MKYEKAVARVELFEAEDIVTASGEVCVGNRKDICGAASAWKGQCIADSTLCIGSLGVLSE